MYDGGKGNVCPDSRHEHQGSCSPGRGFLWRLSSNRIVILSRTQIHPGNVLFKPLFFFLITLPESTFSLPTVTQSLLTPGHDCTIIRESMRPKRSHTSLTGTDGPKGGDRDRPGSLLRTEIPGSWPALTSKKSKSENKLRKHLSWAWWALCVHHPNHHTLDLVPEFPHWWTTQADKGFS